MHLHPIINKIVRAEKTYLSFLREVSSTWLGFLYGASADHIVMPDDFFEATKTGVESKIVKIVMREFLLNYMSGNPYFQKHNLAEFKASLIISLYQPVQFFSVQSIPFLQQR